MVGGRGGRGGRSGGKIPSPPHVPKRTGGSCFSTSLGDSHFVMTSKKKKKKKWEKISSRQYYGKDMLKFLLLTFHQQRNGGTNIKIHWSEKKIFVWVDASAIYWAKISLDLSIWASPYPTTIKTGAIRLGDT